MNEHRFVTSPTTTTSSRPTATTTSTSPQRTTSHRAGGADHRPPAPDGAASITLRAWIDPAGDRHGHDPRSRYVERFWLGVLGPSATWLLRRFQDELVAPTGAPGHPSTVEVDLVSLARQMGMSYVPGRESAFSRAIQRCVMFGVAHHTPDGLAVRRRLPVVAERHLRRLPPEVVRAHDRWVDATPSGDVLLRGRRLARVMADVGDCLDQIEGQLVNVGVEPPVAERIVDELRHDASTPPRPAA